MTRDIRRREAIALLASALAVAPAWDAPDGTRVIELSAESEAIIQELVHAGYHATREEVVTAALEAMMAREGWPLPRGRRANSVFPARPELEGSRGWPSEERRLSILHELGYRRAERQ
jgi:Arc/MetJ-type ribon-helix-helix transcriptional regulator